MLPEHCRDAGIAKAEKAIRELTDAADQLGITDKATGLLVTLWDAFHPGAPPPLSYYKPLERYKVSRFAKPDGNAGATPKRGLRCNVERVDSPEGEAVLQDVLRGLLSQREAARKLGVHPNSVCDAVRRLRQEKLGQPADAPAEIALTFFGLHPTDTKEHLP